MRMLPFDRYGSVSNTMAILVHKSSLHLSINTVPDTVFLLNQVITFHMRYWVGLKQTIMHLEGWYKEQYIPNSTTVL